MILEESTRNMKSIVVANIHNPPLQRTGVIGGNKRFRLWCSLKTQVWNVSHSDLLLNLWINKEFLMSHMFCVIFIQYLISMYFFILWSKFYLDLDYIRVIDCVLNLIHDASVLSWGIFQICLGWTIFCGSCLGKAEKSCSNEITINESVSSSLIFWFEPYPWFKCTI